MQKFYRDKTKIFECNLSVDGAKLNETKARLVLEFKNHRNLLFYGNVYSDGKCEITIPPLKEMEEGEGTAKLEVIAESTYFESWSDDFVLDTSKKVTVEMVEKRAEPINDKPTIKVTTNVGSSILENIANNPELDDVDKLTELKKYTKEKKINLSEVIKSKDKYMELLVNYKKDNKLSKQDILELHDEIANQHKKHLI